MGKNRVIVYGMGTEYDKQKFYIDREWEIVCYADKKFKIPVSYGGKMCIPPSKIIGQPYDLIYITSEKYSEEIKQELKNNYSINEGDILEPKDVWWYVKNAEYRHEWVRNKLLKLPKGCSILDAGAGNMRYRKYCDHLQYKAQDFGQYDQFSNGEWHSSKVDIVSDIIEIPLKDESLDCILCTEVLEHVKDPILVIKEFSRLIHADGVLLLTAPFCSPTHMAPFYFSNGFSKYWYETHLENNGFRIEEIVPFGNWFTYVAQELERLPEIAEKYGYGVTEYDMGTIVDCVRLLLSKAKCDVQSYEFLCFGYLVKAIKI